jgi:hypothetical protein
LKGIKTVSQWGNNYSPPRRDHTWDRHPILVALGVLATLISVFAFVTGFQSCGSVIRAFPNISPSSSAATTPSQVGGRQTTSRDDSTSSRPAKPLREIRVEKKLVCVDYCGPGSDPLDGIHSERISSDIAISRFTIDDQGAVLTMYVAMQPKSNNSGCTFDGKLALQSPSGEEFPAGGQLKDGGSFSLAKGQAQSLAATYSLAPVPHTTYTLKVGSLFCDGHSIGYTPQYSDMQFEF